MSGRKLEATDKAVAIYKEMRADPFYSEISHRALKLIVASTSGISIATLNRALKRDRG